LDGILATAAEINTTSDGTTAKNSHNHTLAVGATDVTASAAEVNKIDGFTGAYTDLNYAKDLRATGVTVTEFDTALDGILATAAEINATSDGSTAKNNHTHPTVNDNLDKIWTYVNVAPTGWAIIAGTTDGLLAVKGGSYAYNSTGGTQVGTWTQPSHTHTGPNHTHTGPNHTHTGPNHTHTTGSHALSIAELAAHTHAALLHYGVGGEGGTPHNLTSTSGNTAYNPTTSSTGSGSAHSHGNTGAGGTGATGYGGTGATGSSGTAATGAKATTATYRPLANLGILIART